MSDHSGTLLRPQVLGKRGGVRVRGLDTYLVRVDNKERQTGVIRNEQILRAARRGYQ